MAAFAEACFPLCTCIFLCMDLCSYVFEPQVDVSPVPLCRLCVVAICLCIWLPECITCVHLSACGCLCSYHVLCVLEFTLYVPAFILYGHLSVPLAACVYIVDHHKNLPTVEFSRKITKTLKTTGNPKVRVFHQFEKSLWEQELFPTCSHSPNPPPSQGLVL